MHQFSDSPWKDVSWSPELGIFCAVGNTGTTAMISSDGIIWTSVTVPNRSWKSITWSSELSRFCAIATSGGTTDRCMVSSTGLSGSWTIQDVADSSIQWGSITWSPQLSLFCIVSVQSSLFFETSPTGLTGSWETRSVPNTNLYNSVTWSPDLQIFCAVSYSGSVNRAIISNNNFSDYVTSTTIGTQGITDMTISAQNLTIGSSANKYYDGPIIQIIQQFLVQT